MSFAYHGKWCGPGWSAGKRQVSVSTGPNPIDKLDDSCFRHDRSYALGGDLLTADMEFAYKNMRFDRKSLLAGITVGLQALGRGITGNRHNPVDKITLYQKMNKNLRIAAVQQTKRNNNKNPQDSCEVVLSSNSNIRKQRTRRKKKNNATLVNPPVTYATGMRPKISRRQQTRDGCILDVSFLWGKAAGASQTTGPEIRLSGLLNPFITGNQELVQIAQVFEKFRITKLDVHYRAFQPTTNGGEVTIIVDEDADTILPATNTGTFYQRAFSGKNTLMTPLWMPASQSIVIDTNWKTIDTLNVEDLRDSASGAVYLIADGTTSNPGFVMFDMTIEFKSLKYNPHSLSKGSYYGPSTILTLTCSTASPTATNSVILSGTGFTVGDVYRLIMQPSAASWAAPAGTTASNLFSTEFGALLPISSAMVIFAVASSTTALNLYTGYSQAASGSVASGNILYGTTGTSAGSFTSCLLYNVGNTLGPAN